MDDGNATGFSGCQAGMTVGTNDQVGTFTIQGATASEPIYKVATSGGSAGNFAGFGSSNGTIHPGITLGLMTDVQWRIQTPTSTNVRYWIALTSYPSAPVQGGFFIADSPSVAISGYSCI
jgi:hypothetical protein